MQIGIIIPAYQPTAALTDLISALQDGFKRDGQSADIIIIDDGSDKPLSLNVLDKLSALSGVSLIRHPENQGKGAALKSGLTYAKDTNFGVVVTADADGQHNAEDIIKVMQRVQTTQDFVLGARDFDGKVPLRSHIGNSVTSLLFRLMLRTKISDTQSGLRGIPARLFSQFLAIPQNGYDYEFQALVNLSKTEKIEHVRIKTIYEPGNPTSHFRPIIDSALIYLVLLRYSLFTILISVFDIMGFYVLEKIIPAAAAFPIIRGISAVIYFLVVRKFVFRSEKSLLWQSLMFALLVLINLLIVTNALYYLESNLAISSFVLYLGSTLVFFAFNFMVQRYVIFKD